MPETKSENTQESLEQLKERSILLEISEDLNNDGTIDGNDLLLALQRDEDDIRAAIKEDIRSAFKNDSGRLQSHAEMARDAMLTLELAHQKGVEVSGDVITVPGRVSLLPLSILQFLLALITLAATLLHYAIISPNFILSVFAIFIINTGSIIVYYTAYLALRKWIQFLQILWNIIFSILINWGYTDQIFHSTDPSYRYALLIVGLITFNFITLIALAHFVYFGRGTRNIIIKTKSKKS